MDNLIIPKIIESVIPIMPHQLDVGAEWKFVILLAIELRAVDAALNGNSGPFDIVKDVSSSSAPIFVESLTLPLQCNSMSQAKIYIYNAAKPF
jgi:hypothetical protein